jgi:hypothetical protein
MKAVIQLRDTLGYNKHCTGLSQEFVWDTWLESELQNISGNTTEGVKLYWIT